MHSQHSVVSRRDPHTPQDQHPAQQHMQNEQLPQLPTYPASEAQQLKQNPQLYPYPNQYSQSSCGQTQQLLGLLNYAPFGHPHDAKTPVSQNSVHMPVQVQHESQSQHHPTAQNGKENVPHDEWHLLLGVVPTDHVSILYWSRTVNDWVDKKLEKCRVGQLEQGFHISLAAISFMRYRADPTQSEEFFEKLERMQGEGDIATIAQDHRHKAPALNARAATYTPTPEKKRKNEDATLVLKSQDKVFVATAPIFRPSVQRHTQDVPPKQTAQTTHCKSEVEPPYCHFIPSYATKELLLVSKYSSRLDSGQPPPPPPAATPRQVLSRELHIGDEVPRDNTHRPKGPPFKTYPKPADLQSKLRLALESSDSFDHLRKMWFERARGQDSKDDKATRSPDRKDEVAK
ncbi:hypothetical protein PtrSN002B_003504 [Pyrenophora tritici-repentis]|uniref:PAT1 multi-domain protein n=2 Tax=Pyrenophora tritici-repentis TaxID=45151 RepID=A0A2W1ELA9_9PLEO|nr:uncharacterized protein PTRG_04827 [Pyrenophora tritici-repentis Pt-1C-BFP]KAF7447078.1 hypothetical protein A1F99_085250 [Pyrenophora tritici-repentis]EDU47734.1 predicted protein [Pyrenophora tritici-repentis Pt-1C-BFP]KAF7569369.1 PAT1 multi-domain protein [Pyrenophora tritici-repentis]KAI0580818.1 hypothetical protein Alg215_05007 [Pyrenophora tritici-repentis]KAI0582503.1 hypothetical protein Alg130_06115 [Pyrenophora tritici-repentis]